MAIRLKCRGCGAEFVWTEKEQEEFAAKASKDTEDEATGDLLDVEPHCRMCREKQDQQRS
jgi:hypothetical protein